MFLYTTRKNNIIVPVRIISLTNKKIYSILLTRRQFRPSNIFLLTFLKK